MNKFIRCDLEVRQRPRQDKRAAVEFLLHASSGCAPSFMTEMNARQALAKRGSSRRPS